MNNRGMVITIIIVYMVLLTFMGSVMGISSSNTIIDGVNFEVNNVWEWKDLFITFFDLLTFDVELPHIVTLFAVYPPLLLLLWYIIELIRGV